MIHAGTIQFGFGWIAWIVWIDLKGLMHLDDLIGWTCWIELINSIELIDLND